MSWISRTYECWLCMAYQKRTQLLSVSSLPLSVMMCSCHACVNLSRLRSSGFTPTLRSGSSPSPTQQRAGHIACRRTFGLYEIFKCAHLNLRYMAENIHTYNFCKCSHASVGRAWASPNYVVYRELPKCIMGVYTGALNLFETTLKFWLQMW